MDRGNFKMLARLVVVACKKKRKEPGCQWLTLLDLITAFQTWSLSRLESRQEQDTGNCNQTRLGRSGLSFMKRSGVKPLELLCSAELKELVSKQTPEIKKVLLKLNRDQGTKLSGTQKLSKKSELS